MSEITNPQYPSYQAPVPVNTRQVRKDLWGIAKAPMVVTIPYILPASGTYELGVDDVSVTITCITPGATIYYTTDGSTPTESSTEYTAYFTVTSTTTVKAKAFKTNWRASSIATETYTIVGYGDIASLDMTDALDPGNHFNVTNIEFYIDGAWESVFGSSKWTAPIYGTWDGTKFVSETTDFGQRERVLLNPTGLWEEAYRPTKIRISLSRSITNVLIDDACNNTVQLSAGDGTVGIAGVQCEDNFAGYTEELDIDFIDGWPPPRR